MFVVVVLFLRFCFFPSMFVVVVVWFGLVWGFSWFVYVWICLSYFCVCVSFVFVCCCFVVFSLILVITI